MTSFKLIDFYKQKTPDYQLLPFKFINLNNDKVILTNMAGSFIKQIKTLLKN